MENVAAPPGFVCPITQELMTQPVSTDDGQTYEKRAIVRWFEEGRASSPATGLQLRSKTLTENVALKKAIANFVEEQPKMEAKLREVQDLRACLDICQLELQDMTRKAANSVPQSEHNLALMRLNLSDTSLAANLSESSGVLSTGPDSTLQESFSYDHLVEGQLESLQKQRLMLKEQQACILQKREAIRDSIKAREAEVVLLKARVAEEETHAMLLMARADALQDRLCKTQLERDAKRREIESHAEALALDGKEMLARIHANPTEVHRGASLVAYAKLHCECLLLQGEKKRAHKDAIIAKSTAMEHHAIAQEIVAEQQSLVDFEVGDIDVALVDDELEYLDKVIAHFSEDGPDIAKAMTWVHVVSDGLLQPTASSLPMLLAVHRQHTAAMRNTLCANLQHLKGCGYLACNFKQIGIQAEDLMRAGFTIGELRNSDFSAEELFRSGCTLEDLRQAAFTANDLSLAGFTAAELHDVGFSLTDMKECGHTIACLRKAGFTIGQLKEDSGFTAHDLMSQGNFTANELKDAGFNAYELKIAGVALEDLKMIGFAFPDLLNAGFTGRELKLLGGFTATELKELGFTAVQLKDFGYAVTELIESGFSPKDLTDDGFHARELISAGFSIQLLKSAGLSACKINEDKAFSAGELKDAGFGLGELTDLGFDVRHLNEAGFTVQDFKTAGFSVGALKDGGLGLSILSGVFPVPDLLGGGFSMVDLLNFNTDVVHDLFQAVPFKVMPDTSIKICSGPDVHSRQTGQILESNQTFEVVESKAEDDGQKYLRLKGVGGWAFIKSPDSGSILCYSQITCGTKFYVAESFKTNSRAPVQLQIGEIGVVGRIDEDGDAWVMFENRSNGQWIYQVNFMKLVVMHEKIPPTLDVTAAGYNIKDFEPFNLSANILKRFGFSVDDMFQHGVPVTELQSAFSVAELLEDGVPVRALKESGCTALQLRKSGVAVSRLRSEGFTVRDLKHTGTTPCEMKESGYTAGQLKADGCCLRDLFHAGFSASELTEVGFSAGKLLAAGCTVRALRSAGFSAKLLKGIGVKVSALREGGFLASELSDAEIDLRSLKKAGFTVGDLKDSGASVSEFREAGFSLMDMCAFYNNDELQELCCQTSDLLEIRFSLGHLNPFDN